MSNETKTFKGSVTIKNPFHVNEEGETFKIHYKKRNFFLHNEEGVAVPIFSAFEMTPQKFVNGELVEEEETCFNGGYYIASFSEDKGFQPVIILETPEFDYQESTNYGGGSIEVFDTEEELMEKLSSIETIKYEDAVKLGQTVQYEDAWEDFPGETIMYENLLYID